MFILLFGLLRHLSFEIKGRRISSISDLTPATLRQDSRNIILKYYNIFAVLAKELLKLIVSIGIQNMWVIFARDRNFFYETF